MSSLGIGFIGAEAAGRRYLDESRAMDEHRWKTAKEEAELSLLDDKTAAERAKYQLGLGQSKADLSLLDYKTAAERAKYQLGLEQSQADLSLLDYKTAAQRSGYQSEEAKNTLEQKETTHAINQLQITNATKEAKNRQDLLNAQHGLKIAPKKHEQESREIEEKKHKWLQEAAIKLAELVDIGHKPNLIAYMNLMQEVAGEKGAGKIIDVQMINDPKEGQVLVAHAEDGRVFPIMSRAQIDRINRNHGKNKLKLKTVAPGHTEVLVNEADGTANPLYTNPNRSWAFSPEKLEEKKLAHRLQALKAKRDMGFTLTPEQRAQVIKEADEEFDSANPLASSGFGLTPQSATQGANPPPSSALGLTPQAAPQGTNPPASSVLGLTEEEKKKLMSILLLK